jgi:hypothetical protein
MRVLITHEESQTVMEAFLNAGLWRTNGVIYFKIIIIDNQIVNKNKC